MLSFKIFKDKTAKYKQSKAKQKLKNGFTPAK